MASSIAQCRSKEPWDVECGPATWSTLNDGLPASLVHDLVIDVTGTSLHAATYTGLFDMEIVWSPRRRTVRH